MARNTNYITANDIQVLTESLEAQMQEMCLLKTGEQLRMQAGSRQYGNSWWIAVTGGEFGTGVSIMTALHAPSNWTAAQFHALVIAYKAALAQVRYAANKPTINVRHLGTVLHPNRCQVTSPQLTGRAVFCSMEDAAKYLEHPGDLPELARAYMAHFSGGQNV